MKFIKLSCAFCLFAATVMLSSCSSGTPVIKVGTMGTYFPFSHMEGDKLTGFDVEVVRLLDEKIEDLEFEFVTGPFDSLLMDMDAGRLNMVANQIAKNPEREEKYLFSEDGYIFVQSKLVVNEGDNTNTTLEDMTGKTMGAINADYFTERLEKYNAENGFPFEIQYYDGEYNSVFSDLSLGRIDGCLNDITVVNGYATNMGLHIKCVGDVLEASYSYLCIRKDETGYDLKTKLDAALKEAREDGSLAAISMEWFGEDFTK